MSNTKTSTILRRIAADYDAVSQGLFELSDMMDGERLYIPEDRLYNYVRLAENRTVDLRNLTARTMRERNRPFSDGNEPVLGIRVEESERWIRITVPGILPHRNRRDKTEFLMRPLRNTLIRFQRETPIERFGDCVICVVHGYDASMSQRRVRDYDNIETKRYLDVIESMLLTDDGGLSCSVLQTSKMSDRDCTEFYIMRPETLSVWVAEHIRSRSAKGGRQ